MRQAIRSLANNSGQVGVGITGGALLVVVGAAMLFIGIFIKAEIKGALPETGFGDYTINATTLPGYNASNERYTNSSADYATLTTVNTNVDTAFTLLGVSMIVTGAAIIISILRSGF